jgi:hypothetical protein
MHGVACGLGASAATCGAGFLACFGGDLGAGAAAGGGGADRLVVSGGVARASVSGSAFMTTNGALRSRSLRRAGKPDVITVAGGGLYIDKPKLGERDGCMST